MGIKFSVVIPSFNNAKALMLTLTSLELQTFPKNRFEVIVVDDGSEDGTAEAINGYSPPYMLTFIANQARHGRAYTRNVGANAAKGKYLLFIDADFLLVPECLQKMYSYHHRYPKHVISGFPASNHAVYTQYHPQLSDHKKKKMRRILQPHGLWKDSWLKSGRIADVLTPDDLRRDFRRIRSAAVPARMGKSYERAIRSTDCAPWIMFITRCVSVKRKHFMHAGGFEERFITYGFEDWELGYRFHKQGLPFKSVRGIIGYHQEHPSLFRKDDPQLDNLRIFYDIHTSKDAEISLMCLCHPLQDPNLYKSILRLLAEWKTRKEYKKLGRIMETALHRAAQAFIYNLKK